MKQISHSQTDLSSSLKEMKNNLINQGYHPSLINELLKRISVLSKVDLIAEKDAKKTTNRIPLVITHNRFLPNITKII